jgi:GDPmannose 4,6-dehydratase
MSGREKRALVTGITGMDAVFLSKILLSKGYKVAGLKRRSSVDNFWRLRHANVLDHENFELIEGDITDVYSIIRAIEQNQPDEIYNLAAQSHVGTSFKEPTSTWNATAQGAINVINAAHLVDKNIKIYQASSSEMFGSNYSIVDGQKCQNEKTVLRGNSPYGVAKVAAHQYAQLMRESYDMFICCGILFNHTSEYRGDNFIIRKITKWLGQFYNWSKPIEMDDIIFDDRHVHSYKMGDFNKLGLGDLTTYRDFGYSADYMGAAYAMMQHDYPDDYVVCTGNTHQIGDVVELAFKKLGLDYKDFTYTDERFLRSREVEFLRGDSSKIRTTLGWNPTHNLDQILDIMLGFDMEIAGVAHKKIGQDLVQSCG